MRHFKVNVSILSVCQGLMMTANSMLAATAALVGAALVSDKSLATLPQALTFVAAMLVTAPASLLMHRLGRRSGFILGAMAGITGAGIAVWAIMSGQFWGFVFGVLLVGVFNGFGTYFRFAAIDASPRDYRAMAVSYVLAGGIVAAFLGPNLAAWTRVLVPASEFAGSYMVLAMLYIFIMVLAAFLRMPPPEIHAEDLIKRPLRQIVMQPVYLVAMFAAAGGFGVMALIMTATPLAMHAHHHPFDDTAFVIQWHIFAMYIPSFFTGRLIRFFGLINMLLVGAVLMVLCVVVNLSGATLVYYWTGLFLLGIGWNFLFVGGTTLLTEAYADHEKAGAQGFNDFLIFSMVAMSSLMAGVLHHRFDWTGVNLGVAPVLLLLLTAIFWLKNLAATGRVTIASNSVKG